MTDTRQQKEAEILDLGIGELICLQCARREAENEPDSDTAYFLEKHLSGEQPARVYPGYKDPVSCGWCGKVHEFTF